MGGGLGFWQGPLYPNASSGRQHPNAGCPHGCLFDILADPTEQHDLKDQDADKKKKFKEMMSRMIEIGKTVYQTDYSGGYDTCASANDAFAKHHGFLSPRCRNHSAYSPVAASSEYV